MNIPYIPFNIHDWEERYKDVKKLQPFNSNKNHDFDCSLIREYPNFLIGIEDTKQGKVNLKFECNSGYRAKYMLNM